MGVCFDNFSIKGRNSATCLAESKVPIVIRTICGGGYRAAAQHSQMLYSFIYTYPGLKTVVPSTPYDAKGLLISSIAMTIVIFFEDITLGAMKGCPRRTVCNSTRQADIKRAVPMSLWLPLVKWCTMPSRQPIHYTQGKSVKLSIHQPLSI